jgi:hypothetical protein
MLSSRMENSITTFEALLYDTLLPDFCSEPKRRCERKGFREESVRIVEEDASYFMQAWNSGLVERAGPGLYTATQSSGSEQFFWEGRKSEELRSFTLWLEPIITFGGLARLHHDYSWPKTQIGTQSVDWAFDIVAFKSDGPDEHIAGEVKKTRKEVDELLCLMQHYGSEPGAVEPDKSGKERNAFKKVTGLRSRRAPIFWALGPDGYSKVFTTKFEDGGVVEFNPADDDALRFPI